MSLSQEERTIVVGSMNSTSAGKISVTGVTVYKTDGTTAALVQSK